MAIIEMKYNIVVLLNHGLGDVIMALPSLSSYIKTNTKNIGTLYLVVKSKVEKDLLCLIDWECNVEIYDIGFNDRWNVIKTLSICFNLRKNKPKYYFSPHSSSGFFPNVISLLINAEFSVGPEGKYSFLGFNKKVSKNTDDIHKVNYYSKFFQSEYFFENNSIYSNIKLIDRDEFNKRARSMLDIEKRSNWIFLAPGSSSLELHKRWLPQYYSKLISKILNNYEHVYIGIIGSPGERLLMKEVYNNAKSKERIRIFNEAQIGVSVSLIKHAKCLVSGCTGTAHIAAMVGTPVVGIYGPTNPSVTGPYAHKKIILRKNYKCSPCYRDNFIKGCGKPECMKDIGPHEVFNAVKIVCEEMPFPDIQKVFTKESWSCEKI